MHQETGVTPFERYYGSKPDLSSLKKIGLRVCVKKSSNRCGKLDQNDFTGIFLGYTATDQNIVFLDLGTGIDKRSHHAQFDEAWYLQATRPPVAQLLYDLGLEVDDCTKTVELDVTPPWPPLPSCDLDLSKWKVSPTCQMTPLPLWEMAEPYCSLTAAAAMVRTIDTPIPHAHHFPLASFLVPELGNPLPRTSCQNISSVKGTWPLSTCLPTRTLRPLMRWSTFANSTLASIAQQASDLLNRTIVCSWEVLHLVPPRPASHVGTLASRVHGLSKLATQRFLPSWTPRRHLPKHMTPGYHPSLCCFPILRFAKTHHMTVYLLSPPHLSLSMSMIK